MKNIVIAGAGPIGLYLAIKLKQLGVTNVTVVDPRAGSYSRNGVIDASVFANLERRLGLPVSHSSSRHIKDAERALLGIATKLGVHIKRGEGTTFTGKKMHVIYRKEKEDKE